MKHYTERTRWMNTFLGRRLREGATEKQAKKEWCKLSVGKSIKELEELASPLITTFRG